MNNCPDISCCVGSSLECCIITQIGQIGMKEIRHCNLISRFEMWSNILEDTGHSGGLCEELFKNIFSCFKLWHQMHGKNENLCVSSIFCDL